MKTLTIEQMKKENEKFLNNVIRIMKNGGDYVCPNTMNHFKVINKKFVPLTKKGYEWIKGVTTSEWCGDNVVPFVDPQMN